MGTLGGIDSATWHALGLTLTLLGLGVSALVWSRRGAARGLRAVAWSLLPLAAALTGVLRLLWELADAVADWAVRLAFSPVVWLGLAVTAVSALLFLASGLLLRRAAAVDRSSAPAQASRSKPVAAGKAPKSAAAGGDEFADIEEILRKHGIS